MVVRTSCFCFACCIQYPIFAFMKTVDPCSHYDVYVLLLLLFWWLRNPAHILRPISLYSFRPGSHKLFLLSWDEQTPIPAVLAATSSFSLPDIYNLLFLPSCRPQAPTPFLMPITSYSSCLHSHRLLLPSWVQQAHAASFFINYRLSPTMSYSIYYSILNYYYYIVIPINNHMLTSLFL